MTKKCKTAGKISVLTIVKATLLMSASVKTGKPPHSCKSMMLTSQMMIVYVRVSSPSSMTKLFHRRYLGLKNKKMRPKIMSRMSLTITMATRGLMSWMKTKKPMMGRMIKRRMMKNKWTEILCKHKKTSTRG